MESTETPFGQFKKAWAEARADPSKKVAAGKLLGVAIEAASITFKELEDARIADRTSFRRWILGENMPQQAQIILLEEILESKGARHQALAISLLDKRYRPALEFLLDQERVGSPLTVEQLTELLDLCSKSKGILSSDLICAYLGL